MNKPAQTLVTCSWILAYLAQTNSNVCGKGMWLVDFEHCFHQLVYPFIPQSVEVCMYSYSLMQDSFQFLTVSFFIYFCITYTIICLQVLQHILNGISNSKRHTPTKNINFYETMPISPSPPSFVSGNIGSNIIYSFLLF